MEGDRRLRRELWKGLRIDWKRFGCDAVCRASCAGPGGRAGLLGMLILVIVLPLVLRRQRPQDNTSLQMAAILILAFYMFCLVLADSSPDYRIPGHAGCVCGGNADFSGADIPRHCTVPSAPRDGPCSRFFLFGKSAVQSFAFEPDQRWQDAAAAVRALFPAGGRYLFPAIGIHWAATSEKPLMSGRNPR